MRHKHVNLLQRISPSFKMRCPAVWLLAALATNIFIVRFVSNVSGTETNGFHCPDNTDTYMFHAREDFTSFENCKAVIISNKIHVKCEAYTSSTQQMPLFTNSTAAVLVIDFMETYQDLDAILTQPFNSSCLKLISSRIQKLDFEESDILKDQSQHKCKIAQELFIPFMLIQLMDIQVVLSNDYTCGIVYYNVTCLRLKNAGIRDPSDRNDSVNVTHCVTHVDIYHRFVESGENLRIAANLSMEDLFTKDFLHVMLMLLKEILYNGYDFSIPYVAFKTGLFKYLPTEALVLLSQKNASILNFSGNGILSIRNGDIPRLDTLQTLDLSECQIDHIEEKAFDGLVSLKTLNLRGNKLTELSFAFRALQNIESLNLLGNGDSKTRQFQYNESIIKPESNLRSLDLSDMVLKYFWENIGILPNLQQLNITNCSLCSMPISSLSSLVPNLTHLRLSGNSLDDLSYGTFSELNKLRVLDLSYTGLSHIQYNDIIEALPSLERISLSANGITEFLPLVLHGDSVLRHLDLSSNKINSWNRNKINASDSVLNLNLIGNNLTEVNSYMIEDFSSLRMIGLAKNPYDCKSCAMKHFLTWLRLVNGSTDFSTTPYTCFFPKEDFEKEITNVTLELCLEKYFDWITNVVIPTIVVFVFITSFVIVIIAYRWHLLYFFYLLQSKVQKYRRRGDRTLFKYDAFVSYCTEDRDWVVNHLIPAIEKQDPKLHLCVHERDFEVGETIMNNVIECIDNSHKSIFVLSKSFIRSQWCHWELQMAQHKLFEDKRNVLILVMLGDISEEETPKILKRLISKRTYLQWPLNENVHRLFWKRLRDAIGKCQCSVHNGA